ncbi:signal transducer and transcription activator-like [Phlebotomus argentipes]|uniref:signal transducer and transcription activator-like n=1 Tax=Phlebotomus argentipes TaxID=94469 RepID=UPI002893690B|nr:signal transducer and transcription activator-like [Phlebotomus argentipes]
MSLEAIDSKLAELRSTLENNSRLLPDLVPHWSDAPDIIDDLVRTLFCQARAWLEELHRGSQDIFQAIQCVLDAFVDFQRDRVVQVPNLRELQRVCETFFQYLKDISEQFLFVHTNRITGLICALSNTEEAVFSAWWNSVIATTQQFIRCTLIYEEQPGPIIRKERIFEGKVRWLIGSQLDFNVVDGLNGRVSILHEHETNKLMEGKFVDHQDKFSVQKNEVVFEVNPNMEVYAKFSKCKIMSISRNTGRNIDKKIDEKYAVVFRTNIVWNGQELEISVISLPICLTTHMTQDEYCYAKIMWDYAFADKNRSAFVVPEEVCWIDFANALSRMWTSWVGCPLNDQHLAYLYDIAFDELWYGNVIKTRPVSWNQITKSYLKGMNFTFWSWFYNNMKLIKDKYGDHWQNNHIYGFIHREHAHALLKSLPIGTFLLRFSKSMIGNMSIDVVLANSQVSSCGPFDSSSFETSLNSSLTTFNGFIRNFVNLKFLHPNIPKNIAFPTQNDVTPPQGYVPLRPKIIIEL